MGKIKLVIGVVAFLITAVVIYLILSDEKALLIHPKGLIARKQLHLMHINIMLMLAIIVPTYVVLFLVAWKYRAKNGKERIETGSNSLKQLLFWTIPSLVVVVMALITWRATHELDPYRPIESSVKSLKIQVVALDWKWLFIYPEEGIASLNFFQFPAQTPIHLEHAADNSPMNSFWLPQISGQIYSMAGMITPLHIMADVPGEYHGRAAEINGEGLADMTFVAKATSQEGFEAWVKQVKQSPLKLTEDVYNELAERKINTAVLLYSNVDKDLFNKIVMKYMHPEKQNVMELPHR